MLIAVDTETTGLNMWTGDRPFMVQILFDSGEYLIYSWDVDIKTRKVSIPTKDRKELINILCDTDNELTFANCKFDIFMLEHIGIKITMHSTPGKPRVHDVIWMSKFINNLEYQYGLKFLAKKYINFPDDDEKMLEEVVKKCRPIANRLGWKIATEETHGNEAWKSDYWVPGMLKKLDIKDQKIASLDLCSCEKYGLKDVERTLALHINMYDELCNLDIVHCYDDERNILEYVMDMERCGLTISKSKLLQMRSDCENEKNTALSYLKKVTKNKNFNPNSNQHIQKMIYGGSPLKLTPAKKTKTGKPKTDGKSLIKYKNEKCVDALFKYKANNKAINTFFDKYVKLANEDKQEDLLVVHPCLDQMGTLTHRFTCKDPNLQQTSSPESSSSATKEYLIDVRKVFTPRDDEVWIAPDYSQIEVIVFADIYNCNVMRNAIINGENVHTATTDRIWGGKSDETFSRVKDLVDISGKKLDVLKLCSEHDWKISEIEESLGFKNYRKTSKGVTFLKIFGGGPDALCEWIGCTKDEAVNILDQFDNAFPDIRMAIDSTISNGKKQRYMKSIFGTILRVDPWYAFRIVNHLVQHTAAKINKKGILAVGEYLKRSKVGKLRLTIHDELLISLNKDIIGNFEKITDSNGTHYTPIKRQGRFILKNIMEKMSGKYLSIPTPVGLDIIIQSWSDKYKVKL